MITELILNAFFVIVKVILTELPPVNFTIPTSFINGGAALFNGLGFFVPVAQLVPFIWADLAFLLLKMTLAIIVRVKSFIPTMGN